MKRLVLLSLLWQGYLISSDDMNPSTLGLRQAFHGAIEIADKAGAVKALARLQLHAEADWKYFDDEQKKIWQNISYRFSKRIASSCGQQDVSTCMQTAKKQEILWLLQKIETDQFRGDWSSIFARGLHPVSKEELKAHEIDVLTKLKSSYDQEG